MNPKRTWLLVIVTLCVFVFIVVCERQPPGSGRSPGLDSKTFPSINPSGVLSVEIIIRTNQILRVERTNETWLLAQPVSYPAYGARIDHLLSAFAQLDRRAYISSQELKNEKQRLSDFGLDPPQAKVIIQQEHGSLEIKIGGKTPVGDHVYVQLVGADGVFYTNPDLLDRLPRSVDDWRNPLFLPLKGLTFNRLKVLSRTGGSASELVMQFDPTNRLWKMTAPMEARADNRKIEELVRQLQRWEIRQFLPENPKTDLDLFGLQPSEVTLSFSRSGNQGTNDLLAAQFGKNPTNDPSLVYARCLPQTNVVLVSRDLLEKLRASYAEFREPRLISTPLSVADSIEVRRGGDAFSLQKQKDGIWLIMTPAKVMADQELMTNFLGNLGGLEIVEFTKDVATDFSNYGLSAPSRQYIMRQALTNSVGIATNRLVAQLDLGSTQTNKVFAKVSGENSVYAIKLTASESLPSQAFQLWDRQIWNFNTNDVRGLTVSLKGQTCKLTRYPDGHWSLVTNLTSLGPPLTNILEETVYRLGKLRAETWIDIGEEKFKKYGFGEANHRLTIETLTGGKPEVLSLDFGEQAPSNNMYASVLLNGQRVIFEFRLALYQLYFELLRHLPSAAVPSPGP